MTCFVTWTAIEMYYACHKKNRADCHNLISRAHSINVNDLFKLKRVPMILCAFIYFDFNIYPLVPVLSGATCRYMLHAYQCRLRFVISNRRKSLFILNWQRRKPKHWSQTSLQNKKTFGTFYGMTSWLTRNCRNRHAINRRDVSSFDRPWRILESGNVSNRSSHCKILSLIIRYWLSR